MNRIESNEGDPLIKQAESLSLGDKRERRMSIGRAKITRSVTGEMPGIAKVTSDKETAIVRRKRIVRAIISGKKAEPCRIERHEIFYANTPQEEKKELLEKWYKMKLPWLPERLGEIINELENIDPDDFEELFTICSLGDC